MLHHEKQRVLETIASEDELRTELVIPLLRKMAVFSDVLDNQGPDEHGVDVIGVSTSPFRKAEYTAFILKHGNITLKASDQKNNIVNIIETQVKEASKLPLSHPRLPSDRLFAGRFVVVTNGTISNKAENVLRKAFYELNLDFVGQDRLIQALDDLWPRFYEDRRPFLSSYATKLFESLNVVDLEELGYAKKKRPLSEIYIDALLYEESDASIQELNFEKVPIAGEKLCDSKHQLIGIISGPGGGKTTLLKEIAILQARDHSEQVAVYLHAREVLNAKDLLRTAAETLHQLSNDPIDDILGEIRNSKLLLLVDGIDELALISDREDVLKKLVAENAQRGTRVIVGTRPESNPGVVATLEPYKMYSISPLKMGQIRRFFGKWFKGNVDKASKLLGALEDKGIFDKLPKTPMTMTLVAIVYESKDDIPSTLTELYEMFVELLTGKWDANRRISSAFDSQMKMSFLSKLSWTMQSERLDTVSQDRCISLAQSFFAHEATLDDVDPLAFIQSIIDRSHILVPTGHDQLRFSHRTFQEYFCAEYLEREPPSLNTITEWFGDDWWKEVLFFYAGKKKNVSGVIEALLATDYENPETRLTKLITLGSMLQSGFLTQAKYKNSAIQFASEKFIACLKDLEDAMNELTSEKVRRRMSRLLLVGLLDQIFTANYCSVHLKRSLHDVFASLPKGKSHQGARFFLANALAKMSDYDPVLDFATDPSMVDTSMYLVSGFNLSQYGLSGEDGEKFKRLKRRIREFGRAISKEMGPPLIAKTQRVKTRRSKKS